VIGHVTRCVDINLDVVMCVIMADVNRVFPSCPERFRTSILYSACNEFVECESNIWTADVLLLPSCSSISRALYIPTAPMRSMVIYTDRSWNPIYIKTLDLYMSLSDHLRVRNYTQFST